MLVGVAAWWAPQRADACSPDFCYESGEFVAFEIANETVSTEGVLLIGGSTLGGPGLPLETVQSLVEITVTDSGGNPVDGSIDGIQGVYTWRPTSPLPAGETLTVAYSVTPEDENCADPLAGTDTVVVVDEPLPTVALPELTFSADFRLQPSRSLDSLVCCDGAYPENLCGSADWFDGYCVSSQGTGLATARIDLTSVDPELTTTTRLEFVIDGELFRARKLLDLPEAPVFSYQRSSAFELVVRVVDLATGEAIESEVFVADGGEEGALGSQGLDVTAELEESCEAQPYVCQHDGSIWDQSACTPYGDDGETTESASDGEDTFVTDGGDGGFETNGDETGDTDADSGSGSGGDAAADDTGGCSVGGSPAWGTLALFGLFGLRRRRG
ncbi:MAG: MYXO-CTERM sorting domain-containing protein [Myxococcota bacterium]